MVYLYSASAGSGKTYTLTIIYLKEIANRIKSEGFLGKTLHNRNLALSKILALTFTNKASFEMKERILSFLEDLSLSKGNWEKLSEETLIEPKLAEAILEHIFLHYHKLQVSTIDSYLYRLFCGLSFELELPSQLRVEKSLRDEFLESALLRFYNRAKNNEELMSLLEELLEFILNEEEKGVINLKARLVGGLKNYIEQVVRGKKVERASSSEVLSNEGPYKRAQLYYRVFEELKKELEEILLSNRRIYMGFWKEKLKDYLSAEELLPWAYFKLGKVECLIKDESQDTDILHFYNLSPIFENLLAEGNPIYLAWDPKQSIYQWRGANPDYIFLWITELKQKNYQVVELKLDENYRSCGNIVEFNNTIFSPLKKDDVTKVINILLYESCSIKSLNKYVKNQKLLNQIKEFFFHDLASFFYKKLNTIFKDLEQEWISNYGGKVIIHYLDSESQTNQNQDPSQREVYKLIKSFLEEFSAKEEHERTAILLRENKQIEELSQFLMGEGVAIASKELAKLDKSPLILGLVGYLELLTDEKNNLALTKILVNLFPEEGKKILDGYAKKVFWAKNSVNNSNSVSLWKHLENTYPEFFRENIYNPIHYGRLLSPYDFLQYLWKGLNFCEKFPEEKPFLYSLLSLLLSKQKEGYSLAQLLPFLKEEIQRRNPNLPEHSKITVLTIHSAKGLEFDNVITVLDYDPSIRGGSGSPLFFRTSKGYFYGKKSELNELEEWKHYFEGKLTEFLEMINLIYVSFTRAKKNLYIIVPVKKEGRQVVGKSDSAKLFIKLRNEASIRDLPFVKETGEVP